MSPVIEADVRLSLDIKGVNIPQQAPNFFEIIPQDREGPKSPLLKQLRVPGHAKYRNSQTASRGPTRRLLIRHQCEWCELSAS